jgi:hypothetical protein
MQARKPADQGATPLADLTWFIGQIESEHQALLADLADEIYGPWLEERQARQAGGPEAKAFAADDYPVIYGEDFTCACGNDSGKSGFSPCTPEGVEMEPAKGWEGHYLCNKCKLVLVQAQAPPCQTCAETRRASGPSHNGQAHCTSGSIASGGTHAHCTCDICF